MSRFRDLTGQKFGRLTVLERAPNSRHGNVRWLCVCEDGNQKESQSSQLLSGDIRSCGCLGREVRAQPKTCAQIAAITKHGHTRHGTITTEYRSWQGMLGRCHNRNHRDYKNWGGRGIAVCHRWKFVGVRVLSRRYGAEAIA
jgi:hypothetical protein